MREKLTFVIGNTEDFNALGIDIANCRQSLDGTKVLKHREHLDSLALNSILVDVMLNKTPFVFIGDTAVSDLMQTAEWRAEE